MHIIDELQSTLEKTSFDDDNGIFMVDSQLQVCSFDDVKKRYVCEKIPLANPNPKSNDALFFGESECCFIEFKNGKIDNAVNYELNKKIYDSLLILFDLQYSDKRGRQVNSISYTRENMSYILVYNEEKYLEMSPTKQTNEGIRRQQEASKSLHRNQLYKAMRQLAGEELILFGLDQFVNYLFKSVHTYTEKEFMEKVVSFQ